MRDMAMPVIITKYFYLTIASRIKPANLEARTRYSDGILMWYRKRVVTTLITVRVSFWVGICRESLLGPESPESPVAGRLRLRLRF